MHHEATFWQRANKIGLFLVAIFAICFAWYFIHGAEQALHLQLFQLSFIGLTAMNLTGFILGGIQSYIWGVIFVAIWDLIKRAKL